ncbi:MAG: thioredoxin-dependent thiol peroxidase [Parvibaculum sp.]|nr:thioredoxin-dependent thiol peroxidase [Parvibaculum sp.]
MTKTTTTEAKKATARRKAAPKETPGKSRTVPAAAAASGLPEAGKKAPAFSLSADDGTTVSLRALAGKKAVLYFYPKDNTPGCTTEAIAFSALQKKFDAAGAVVIGVSKDTIDRHRKFRDKHKLTVRLLSDEDGKMLEACGVWAEKSLYGRKFMGIVRTTFLIDEKGVVRRVWPKVKVKDHAEEVLAAVKDL